MPNCNQETGIVYGIISANSVPYLADDIYTNGDSLSYAEYKKDLGDEFRAALLGVLEDRAFRAEEIAERLDIDQLVEDALNAGLNDQLEFDEEEYEYSDGAAKYLLSYLGGAPLIWITESEYVTHARRCSPCIPGGADLDSIDPDGMLCYCPAPDDFASDAEDAPRYEVTGTIEIAGKTFKVVAQVAPVTE